MIQLFYFFYELQILTLIAAANACMTFQKAPERTCERREIIPGAIIGWYMLLGPKAAVQSIAVEANDQVKDLTNTYLARSF